MPVVKRAASPDLVSKPSPFHSGVTIFEAPGPSTPRRSKRIKTSHDEQENTLTSQVTTTRKATAKVVKKEDDDVKTEFEEVTIVKRKRKESASPRKAKAIPQSLAVPHPAPPKWKEQYDAIHRMREGIVAPVDTMGCDQAQTKEVDPRARRLSTLVSLMLSSQTKDEVTDAAVAKLRAAAGGTLTVESILDTSEQDISEAIAKVGFWRRKTQYIKQTAQKLQDEFDSDVPKTVDELCSLPGVGPKMAFLALQVAWNINVGIGVDVHVHRITNRLHWHKSPTKNPEETRLNLQSWLPTELHPEINHMLVGFGQTICTPLRPKCESCDLSSGLCPSASVSVKRTSKKTKAVVASSTGDAKIKIELEVEETKPSIRFSPDSSCESGTLVVFVHG